MAENAVAPPALIKFVRELARNFDIHDGVEALAIRYAIDALTAAERDEIPSFCKEWLAKPVPPKHSGRIRMIGLGRFRMSRAQLGNLRDTLVATQARGRPKGSRG